MRILIKSFTVIMLSVFSIMTYAEQKEVKGNWDIHYIAFPATFLEPEVAKNYGLIRSKYKGVVNISILANDNKMKAQNAFVSGTAKNLLGQSQKMSFKKVQEGDAIYFLAQMDYHNEEIFNFKVEVQQGDRVESIKFSKKFYVD